MRGRMMICVLAAALCAACVPRGPEGLPGGKVLRFNNNAEPETLDPALLTGMPDVTLATALFEGLVAYDPKTLATVPGVAERWEMSADGLTYTFHLRESVWSNGERLTAEDFVYSWRRVLEPETAAKYAYQLWYIKNAAKYTKGELKDFSQVGIRSADERTIEVTLEHPTVFFLDLLAFPTYMPVNRGCVEKFGSRWTRPGSMVGNGPFVLAEWKAQDQIVMRKNPRYWRADDVKLDGIVAFAITDENTALRRYKAGELDWVKSLPDLMVPRLKERPDYHRAVSLGTHFYRFNCSRKPFDDVRVRKAFDLALDKRKICQFVLHGQYEPAAAFVPPALPGYVSPPGLGYDPRRAAELLAEAGYPGGRGFPPVTLVYNTSNRHEQVAAVAKQMWKDALGVDVNLVNQEWKVYLRTTQKLDYDIIRSAWIGDYMDANTFLDMFVTNGGNNRTGWSNARYDELIAEAARTADAAKRTAMLREAEDILVNEEVPILPIYFDAHLGLRRTTITGVYDNARNIHPFQGVDME